MKISKPAREPQSDTLLVVLPILSILAPVVIFAGFIAWFWLSIGSAMDDSPLTGTDRVISALWLFAAAVWGIVTKYWYVSVPFCIVAVLAIRQLIVARSHAHRHPDKVA